MTALRRQIDDEGGEGRAFERDLFAAIPRDFRTEAGDRLDDPAVRVRLHGDPALPLVIVTGGISSGRFVCTAPGGAPGWWADLVGLDKAVDLGSVCVLGFDFAPTVHDGPLTLTTHDQARLLALALDALGVERAHGFVGASYGGMVALAFAELFPERLDRLVVISAAHRAHPLATAWRGVQRRILQFAEDAGRPEEGIALARQLAMTTYRTPEEFDLRFDGAEPPAAAGGSYPVCRYLEARGEAYPPVMHARRWIALSDSMDRHRVDPAAVRARTTLVGVTSDRLVPLDDVRALARGVPGARLIELPSLYGHDAFLKETEALAPVVRSTLETL